MLSDNQRPPGSCNRFGFFRARYASTGIYAASTAKRVVSQKSPCKNEERRKEEEENGERYRLKTVKSGSTLSPVQAGEADSWLLSLFLSLSFLLCSFWTPNPIKGGCAGSEKRSAWRIAAAVRSPRRFVNRPIALVPVRELRRHHCRCIVVDVVVVVVVQRQRCRKTPTRLVSAIQHPAAWSARSESGKTRKIPRDCVSLCIEYFRIPDVRLRFGHGRNKVGDFNQKRKLNYLFHT